VLNDVHAAVALVELEEIESIVCHNRSIYECYLHELGDVEGIEVLKFEDDQQTSFKNIEARVLPSFSVDRDQLVSLLNDLNILARPHYYPALHTKTYQYPVRSCDMHVSNQLMMQFLNLPCGARVSVDDVKTVCGLLRSLASE
jgi:dTDP-4-amino-4,6-dideoxygalactose transaminase